MLLERETQEAFSDRSEQPLPQVHDGTNVRRRERTPMRKPFLNRDGQCDCDTLSRTTRVLAADMNH